MTRTGNRITVTTPAGEVVGTITHVPLGNRWVALGHVFTTEAAARAAVLEAHGRSTR